MPQENWLESLLKHFACLSQYWLSILSCVFNLILGLIVIHYSEVITELMLKLSSKLPLECAEINLSDFNISIVRLISWGVVLSICLSICCLKSFSWSSYYSSFDSSREMSLTPKLSSSSIVFVAKDWVLESYFEIWLSPLSSKKKRLVLPVAVVI